MFDLIKTTADLQDKKVHVKMSRGEHQIGIVLGEDRVFKDTIIVGVTENSFGTKKPAGAKYISLFRARRKQLTILEN